jgi:hypothetical protein
MRLSYTVSEDISSDWQESLLSGFDLGLPSLFNIEWLIDNAERSEWGRIQW